MQNAIFQYKSLVQSTPKGIYITLNGEPRWVCPKVLYSKLWDCYKREWMGDEFEASFQIFKDEVWCYIFDYRSGQLILKFERDSFISDAKTALQSFCEDIITNNATIYQDRYLSCEGAQKMVEGLQRMIIPQNYSQLFSTDVKVEKFTFKFIEEYSCDTEFIIGFGDRLYRSSFSDWSNEFEILRYELEGLVVRGRGQVELNFEDASNIIDVRGCYLHDTRDSSCVKVTFTPDGFVGSPILFGYCKRKEVVEKLYRGFMELFSRDTSWFDDGHEGVTWDEFRANAIAQLRSQIIEEYLRN
jgi:hypothetical protein